MAIKGTTINVTLDPRAYKELNPLENIIPTHLDLRNGHYTDAKYWEHRPGYLEVAVLVPTEETPPPPPPPPGGTGEVCADCPGAQFAEVSYTGATTPGAVVIRLTAASTASSTTAVGAYYNPTTNQVKLVAWVNQPRNVLPTVLATASLTLASSDVLKVQQLSGNGQVVRVQKNGVTVISNTTVSQLVTTATCTSFWNVTG